MLAFARLSLFVVEELEDQLSQTDASLQEKKQRIAALESQAKQKEVCSHKNQHPSR